MILQQAKAFLPQELTALAALFKGREAALYAVGGLPRNAVLGLPPSDIDICSALAPEAALALCRENGIRCFEKALKFGTIEIHMNGYAFEHTTFRGDEYGAGGAHRPRSVRFGATLAEDAFRRDFTCNALYLEVPSCELIDPAGGLADIEARRIRATSADPGIILRDDALRVLRLVRFGAELGFSIEEGTWAAAKAYAPGLVDIAWERRRDELDKILLSDARYPSLTKGVPSTVLTALLRLYELGALGGCLLPELLEGDGVPQRPRFHAYDVLRHNLHACAASEPDLTIRLASLLHDVGKPAALREKGLDPRAGGQNSDPPGLPHGTTPMLHHDALGVPMAEAMLKRLCYPRKLIEDVLFLVENHMYDLNFQAKSSTLRARFASFGYRRSEMLCAVREADIRGSGYCPDFVATPWRALLRRMREEGAPFSFEELACTGSDIMQWLQLPPGPAVGEIKERMLRHCARHPQDNTRERLRRLAKGMLP